MNRKGRMILSVLLIAAMLCGSAFSAAAVRAPRYIGDADCDGAADILDATRIQRWLAGLSRMSSLDQFAADVNGDGRLDILDATRIQRKLAGLGGFYDDDKEIYNYFFGYYIEDFRFFADYDSGKARVGTPVIFYAEAISPDAAAYGNPQNPITYEFFVNAKQVQARSENNELAYTFTAAGSYQIKVIMYNAFDDAVTAVISSYQVVEPYPLDRPVIVSTLFRDDTDNCKGRSALYLRTEGGSGGPYTYMVTARERYDGYEKDGFFIEEPVDAYSPVVISTGYSVGAVYQIPRGLYRLTSPIPEQGPEAVIVVYAKDSAGNVSDPVTVCHRVENQIG